MATEKSKKGHLSKSKGKHESHVRRLDDGFHVTNSHPENGDTEHAASSLDDAMKLMQDHMVAGDQTMAPDEDEQATQEPAQ